MALKIGNNDEQKKKLQLNNQQKQETQETTQQQTPVQAPPMPAPTPMLQQTTPVQAQFAEQQQQQHQQINQYEQMPLQQQQTMQSQPIPPNIPIQSQPQYQSQPMQQQQSQAELDVKGKKNKKKKVKKEKKPKKKKTYDSADAAYRAYKKRKIGVYAGFIILILVFITTAVYNTFFKNLPSGTEIAVYTNSYNGQTKMQKWDSGVEGWLQANFVTVLNESLPSSADKKVTVVSNIAVDKNMQYSDDTIISYFSADITYNGTTIRQLFIIPLTIINDNGHEKLVQGGPLEFSTTTPLTTNNGKIQQPDDLKFIEETADSGKSESLKSTLDSFFTLAYNTKGDYSQYYKGDTELILDGTFEKINDCKYYESTLDGKTLEAIDAGVSKAPYNAYVEYTVQLPNGLTIINKVYMYVTQLSNGAWQINKIGFL